MDTWPILLSLKLAFYTVICVLSAGIPLGYYLASGRSAVKTFLEGFLSLPLVLPPSVLGFYILLMLGPGGFIGGAVEKMFGTRLVFTFEGIVIACVIYSLPFFAVPFKDAVCSLPKSMLETSYSLGAGRLKTFFRVILPNIKNTVMSGILMVFAHTMGAFGVVLMIGGNIPGRTDTASIAVYTQIERLDYLSAHKYAAVLGMLALSIVFLVNRLKQAGCYDRT